MKPNRNLFALPGALLLLANPAAGASVYDNNISALNINMLTDVFMSYTNYGDKMSDLFTGRTVYGTMNRFGEYGDDGSTIQTFEGPSSDRYLINNIWLNANHVNAQMRYGDGISQHGRFNLVTVGGTTQKSHLTYGNISFGGFVSYINTKMPDFTGGGSVVGLFANYKYHGFGARALLDNGSLNNGDTVNFNNSWINFALDLSHTFKIDDTFLIRPGVYGGYTFVSSDDLHLNGDKISSKDYHFFNVAPGIKFIKEISPNWYGALSAKYVAHFGGDNDINIGDSAMIKGLDLDNHTDIGLDIEHNYKHFVFGGNVHKQMGGMDGWSGNINIKYVF